MRRIPGLYGLSLIAALKDAAKIDNITGRITALEGKGPRTVSPNDVSAGSMAEILRNGKPQFQMADEIEATDRLVAVHNKSVSGQRRMLRRGGRISCAW